MQKNRFLTRLLFLRLRKRKKVYKERKRINNIKKQNSKNSNLPK